MIAYLSGSIFYKGQNYLVLFQNGLGYKVYVPTDILAKTKLSQNYSLHIYTHLREDLLELYGFESFEDLSLFESFLTVPGIGPKLALSIFSHGKVSRIKEAIIRGDVDFFLTVPRLGKKNAQKIIIELRPKLGALGELDLTKEGGETKEILEALYSFGFSPQEAKEAIRSLKDFEGTTSEKIRQALKFLGKK